METEYEIINQCLIVHLSGELDQHLVDQLRVQMDQSISTQNIKHLIFDFANITFMDSSGIGMVIGRYKQINRMGGQVFIVAATANLQRILNISGLLKIINQRDTIDQALKELQ